MSVAGLAEMRAIGGTKMLVSPLCLGTNVFGWTIDEPTSFEVLDAYAAAGGNFLDTSDNYSDWVPGNSGGESEAIVGRWMRERGNRDDLVIATKVGQSVRRPGTSRANVKAAIEASLDRLGTDRIDLYYAHLDDRSVPMWETLEALDKLVRAGRVRELGASNYEPARLKRAIEFSERESLAGFRALQTEYNLMERTAFEGGLAALAARFGLGVLPYYALAQGFLTGKCRPKSSWPNTARREAAGAYLTPRGERVLHAASEVAAAHGTSIASVALAWLAGHPTVVAPIASVTSTAQLENLISFAGLELTDCERARLDLASAH